MNQAFKKTKGMYEYLTKIPVIKKDLILANIQFLEGQVTLFHNFV